MDKCKLVCATPTIPTNTDTTVPWPIEDYKTSAGMHSTATNPERLYLPTKGIWDIKWAVSFPANSGLSDRKASLYLSPSTLVLTAQYNLWKSATDITWASAGVDLLVAATGLYLYVVARQDTGVSMVLPNGWSYLSAHQARQDP